MFRPYENEALNLSYNLLFCDDLELFRSRIGEEVGKSASWHMLIDINATSADLSAIMNDRSLESRKRLLASRRLLQAGVKPDVTELLGVVIEVGLEEGLDVLAAYADQTARYINYSEKLVIWEANDIAVRPLFVSLLEAATAIVSRIGPWDKARLPFPQSGNCRITLLVTDGIYFGHGPTPVLFNDPMAEPALKAGINLMKFLTEASLTRKE